MESPAQDLAAFRAALEAARQALGEFRWEAARHALEQAIALDPLQPKPLELLAEVMTALNDPGAADTLRQRAKALRAEQWKREVEAEIRGRHELTGGPARREIP